MAVPVASGSMSRDYLSWGALVWLQSTRPPAKKFPACRSASWLAGYAELDVQTVGIYAFVPVSAMKAVGESVSR